MKRGGLSTRHWTSQYWMIIDFDNAAHGDMGSTTGDTAMNTLPEIENLCRQAEDVLQMTKEAAIEHPDYAPGSFALLDDIVATANYCCSRINNLLDRVEERIERDR